MNLEFEEVAGALADTNFQIGDVHFKILPLGAMDGWRLLEYLRVSFGAADRAFEGESISSQNEVAAKQVRSSIMAILASVPNNRVEHVRQTLFHKITFKHPSQSEWLNLENHVDQAFEKLGAGAIYEVLMRGLCANFTPSILRLAERLNSIKPSTSSQSPRAGSPPSSPI